MNDYPWITNPLQRRVLEALDVLANLVPEAEIAGNQCVMSAAAKAERALTILIAYSEGPEGERGIPEGEPLPWFDAAAEGEGEASEPDRPATDSFPVKPLSAPDLRKINQILKG